MKRSKGEDTAAIGSAEKAHTGGFVVTIDGPAGAGKTTVSKALARRLGFRYIDTGALYRAVALAAVERGVAFDDDRGLAELVDVLDLAFVSGEDGLRLFANGTDVTDRIRNPEISMAASAVSARPVVRRFLLSVQRKLGSENGAVFEGRDMGTVVFPDAAVKFFLSASPEVRALRRYREYGETGIRSQSLETVEKEMRQRDENDSRREIAPLKAADDAIRIDSSVLTVDAVVDEMFRHVDSLRSR